MYNWLWSWWAKPLEEPEPEPEPEPELEPEEIPERTVATKYKVLYLFFVTIGVMSSGLALSTLLLYFFTDESHLQFGLDKVVLSVVVSRRMNLSDAEQYCAEHFLSGQLAVVRSKKEEDSFMRQVKEQVSSSQEMSACQALLIGYRRNASRKWQPLDQRSYLPTLTFPSAQAFPDDSNDCIVINVNTNVVTPVPCFRRYACALCETSVNCSSVHNSLDNGCYKLEADPVARNVDTSRPQHLDSHLTTSNATAAQALVSGSEGDSPKFEKEMPHQVGLDFSDWQALCWNNYQGRLAAFLHKQIPGEVRQEMLHRLKKSHPYCKGSAAARLVMEAFEYETVQGGRISYQSRLIGGAPGSDECLAIHPRHQFRWLSAPCHQPMCFVCTKG